MMLKDSYFTIKNREEIDGKNVYSISLLAGSEIYKGHFPGNPISPGVCSIQMIRECAEEALNKKLQISEINQCRFLSLLTPAKGENLSLTFGVSDVENGYKIDATLSSTSETFVTMKATFTHTN